MNKTLMLFLVLLICSLWMQAQPAYQGSGAGQTAESTPDPNTLEGCLQSSDGEYTVTDKNGVIHHLSDGGKVKHYVGHEVQLTGTPSIRTIDTTLAGGASSAIEKPVFRVKTAKDVAATCQSSAK